MTYLVGRLDFGFRLLLVRRDLNNGNGNLIFDYWLVFMTYLVGTLEFSLRRLFRFLVTLKGVKI